MRYIFLNESVFFFLLSKRGMFPCIQIIIKYILYWYDESVSKCNKIYFGHLYGKTFEIIPHFQNHWVMMTKHVYGFLEGVLESLH